MSSQLKVKQFVGALIYRANFKKVNLYVSTDTNADGYNIYGYDWDFTNSMRWDPQLKKKVIDKDQEFNQSHSYGILEARNLSGSDLYWMVNSSPYQTLEPSKDDITHGRAFYLDLDYQIIEGDLLQKLSDIGLPDPTLYFPTLKGWQVFWILDKAILLRRKTQTGLVDLAALDQYLAINQAICKQLGGDDKTLNLNRKMRVPNTYRWKGEKNSFFCSSKGNWNCYRLEEFMDFLAKVAPEVKKVAPKKPRKAKQTKSQPPKGEQLNQVDTATKDLDLGDYITLDEFNNKVADLDFRSLVGLPREDTFCCPFSHKKHGKEKRASATFRREKGKYRFHCFTCAFDFDVRDFMREQGKTNSAIFKILKEELGTGKVLSKKIISGLEGLEREFKNISDFFSEREEFGKGKIKPSSRCIEDIRLVCSILESQFKTTFLKGKSTLTISTNHFYQIVKKSPSKMTKKKMVGILNTLCYLGILEKSINPIIKKQGRGISEFELLGFNEAKITARLSRLKINNFEKFNEKWVRANLGDEDADKIFLCGKKQEEERLDKIEHGQSLNWISRSTVDPGMPMVDTLEEPSQEAFWSPIVNDGEVDHVFSQLGYAPTKEDIDQFFLKAAERIKAENLTMYGISDPIPLIPKVEESEDE